MGEDDDNPFDGLDDLDIDWDDIHEYVYDEDNFDREVSI